MSRDELSLLDFAPAEMALRHHLAYGWPQRHLARVPEGEVALAVKAGVPAAQLDPAAGGIASPEDAVALVKHGCSDEAIQALERSFPDDVDVLRAIHLKLGRPRATEGDFALAVSEHGTWDDFDLVRGGSPMSLTALAHASRKGMTVEEALAPRVEGDLPFTPPEEVDPDLVPPGDLRDGLEFLWRGGRTEGLLLSTNASTPEAVAAIDGLVGLVVAESVDAKARGFLEQLLTAYPGAAPLQESTPPLPIGPLTAATGPLSQPQSLELWSARYPLTAADLRALVPHAPLFAAEMQEVYIRATPDVFRLLLTTPELSGLYFRCHPQGPLHPGLVEAMSTPVPRGHATDYLHMVGETFYRTAAHSGETPIQAMRCYLRGLWDAGYLPTGLGAVGRWHSGQLLEYEWSNWVGAADIDHLMGATWGEDMPAPLWATLADKFADPEVPRDATWRRFVLEDLLPALPRWTRGAGDPVRVRALVMELAAAVDLEHATDLSWASQWLREHRGMYGEVLASTLLPAIARSSAAGADTFLQSQQVAHLLGPAAVGGHLTGAALRKASQQEEPARDIAKAVLERFGTDIAAWDLVDALLKDWAGNLPDLLNTVEGLQR